MPDLEIKGFFHIMQGYSDSYSVGQKKISFLSFFNACAINLWLSCVEECLREMSLVWAWSRKPAAPRDPNPVSNGEHPSSKLCSQGDIAFPSPHMNIICWACRGLNLISGKLMGHLPLALTELQTDPSLFLFCVFLANSCSVFWALTTDQKIQECFYVPRVISPA